MAVWLGGISTSGGRDRGAEGDTDEQPLSDKPPLVQSGETYSAWQ